MILISNAVVIVTIIMLLVLLSMIWPPDSPWAPWWRTNRKVAQAMCTLGKITAKDTIYDLGCGDGTALITAAKEYGAKGVGIEIDPLRAKIAAVRIRGNNVHKSVTIIQKNFFDIPFTEASVVFVYLVPNALLRLKQKFYHELSPGTRIISYRYEIAYLPLLAKDEKNHLFLYQIPRKK